jgi:hypothetical protein
MRDQLVARPLPTHRINAHIKLGYFDVTVQEKLRSGWAGPFVKVEGCCD